jgi:hypothetical protein
MSNTDLAQLAYSAYGQSTDGLNYRGEKMPTWEALPLPIQIAWEVAAIAVKRGVESVESGVAHIVDWRTTDPVRQVILVDYKGDGTPFTGVDVRVKDATTNEWMNDVQAVSFGASVDDGMIQAILIRIAMDETPIYPNAVVEYQEIAQVVGFETIGLLRSR